MYFDGKKSVTKIIVRNENITSQRYEKKEHLVLLKEGGGCEYISHITPATGNSKDITDEITKKLKERNIDTGNLKVIGADGCMVNTGWIGGIIRRLEVELNRALQRSICLLHLGELPLRAVYEELYGKSKGPNKLQGDLGDSLEICHTLPTVKFKVIRVANFPKFDTKSMSQDQQYLFQLAAAVSSGKISVRLASRTPGKLCQSRWLTLAARILRFYITQLKPSPNLTILALYIMKIYIPHWQMVKTQNSISFGSVHFLELIKKTR